MTIIRVYRISFLLFQRMLVFEVGWEPSPCTLFNAVTLLTTSASHLTNVHLANEKFYRNETRCVFFNENGVHQTIDRNTPLEFQFSSVAEDF